MLKALHLFLVATFCVSLTIWTFLSLITIVALSKNITHSFSRSLGPHNNVHVCLAIDMTTGIPKLVSQYYA